MSKTANMWVVQLDGAYYAKWPFCGGTYDIEDAKRSTHKPTPLVGKAVEVVVTTTVEVKAHG